MRLDPKHNSAIREEIGTRLKIFLSRDKAPLPPQLSELVRRFDETDTHVSPSIVPDAYPEPIEAPEFEPVSIWLRDWQALTRRMTNFAKLLARKRQLLERLHEEERGSYERDELERRLASINTALHSRGDLGTNDNLVSEPRPSAWR
jgi:hypothetical protein